MSSVAATLKTLQLPVPGFATQVLPAAAAVMVTVAPPTVSPCSREQFHLQSWALIPVAVSAESLQLLMHEVVEVKLALPWLLQKLGSAQEAVHSSPIAILRVVSGFCAGTELKTMKITIAAMAIAPPIMSKYSKDPCPLFLLEKFKFIKFLLSISFALPAFNRQKPCNGGGVFCFLNLVFVFKPCVSAAPA